MLAPQLWDAKRPSPVLSAKLASGRIDVKDKVCLVPGCGYPSTPTPQPPALLNGGSMLHRTPNSCQQNLHTRYPKARDSEMQCHPDPAGNTDRVGPLSRATIKTSRHVY